MINISVNEFVEVLGMKYSVYLIRLTHAAIHSAYGELPFVFMHRFIMLFVWGHNNLQVTKLRLVDCRNE